MSRGEYLGDPPLLTFSLRSEPQCRSEVAPFAVIPGPYSPWLPESGSVRPSPPTRAISSYRRSVSTAAVHGASDSSHPPEPPSVGGVTGWWLIYKGGVQSHSSDVLLCQSGTPIRERQGRLYQMYRYDGFGARRK